MTPATATPPLMDFSVRLGAEPRHLSSHGPKLRVRNANVWYGEKHALRDVTLDIYRHEVTAFIGPSGCGKTTLLRCMNRSIELIENARQTGQILIDDQDISDPELEVPLLRRRFGWVAQRPNPFPWSVRSNVAYGIDIHGLAERRDDREHRIRSALEAAGLWDEVKDRLDEPGTDLSGGQQQRLCVARAIAYEPEVLLMDEPASALDPTATARLEQLIDQLRERFTIVIITHNMQQAARISQRVAMFHLGRLIEHGDASDVLVRPKQQITIDYVSGRFG